tara:strand:+ start:503 stop:757 length:255 start_codon:yes stop_codon:yes gene_type:complete
MVGVLIMSLVKFTVNSDLYDLVDAIGLEYEKVNGNYEVTVDLEYEREQYDIDVDYLLNEDDYTMCTYLLGDELANGLISTKRLI